MPHAVWRLQGSEGGWPWDTKGPKGSKSDSEDAVGVCACLCV